MSADPLDDIALAAMKQYGVPIPNPRRWIPHTPNPRQALFLRLPHLEAFYGGAGFGGKALDISTQIATPAGWTTMGELVVGDWVFDSNGVPTRIVATSDIHFEDTFEVEFSDGSVLVAGANHKWITSNEKERARILRGTAIWREERRNRRKSRAAGKKTARFTSQIVERNHKNPPPVQDLPTSSVRTTREIECTVKIGKRGYNHSVPVSQALELPESDLLIDPYVLGAWLGDGTSASSGITGLDEEIFEQVQAVGYEVVAHANGKSRRVTGLITQLKQLGVAGNKHIPASYLRASSTQRLAVLQGLMDTDGSCNTYGQCEITLTKKRLAADALELILSLGIKCTIRESGAYLNRRYIGQRYRLKFSSDHPVFRLPRKLIRQKRRGHRSNRRYITAVRATHRVPLRCIQVESSTHCYLAGKSLIPTHNSDALLMGALQHVDIPGYNAIIFRRTLEDFKLPDSLLPRSRQWLERTGARWSAQDFCWRFPLASGRIVEGVSASLWFGYLADDSDKWRYDSSAYQYIGFDEVTQFQESQYRFLFARLRKLKNFIVPLRMRSGSNPGGPGQTWVKERFIPDGFLPAMAEEMRTWEKEIQYDRADMELLSEMLDGEPLPTHRAFVPARMTDNPHGDRKTYTMSLYQLDRVTREQRLKGDWSIFVGGRMRFLASAIEKFIPQKPQIGHVRLAYDTAGRPRPQWFSDPDQGLIKVWHPPQKGKTYAAGADTAEGRDYAEPGSSTPDPDYSVLGIREAHSGIECARLRGRITEGVFAELAYPLLLWYNSPFLCPEIKGGYGRAFLNKLLEMGWPPDYVFNRHMIAELAGQPPYRGEVGLLDLGWPTSSTNRPTLIERLDDAITNHTIETYDSVAIDEYRHFCYTSLGPPRAETGWHDDCVIEDSLCEVARMFAIALEPQRRRAEQNAVRSVPLQSHYGQERLTPAERRRILRENQIRKGPTRI